MRKRITKRSVDSLRPGPQAVFLWDTEISGFGSKVTPLGRKVYIFQYRVRGQSNKTAPKRVTLGKHGEMTPDRARRRGELGRVPRCPLEIAGKNVGHRSRRSTEVYAHFAPDAGG